MQGWHGPGYNFDRVIRPRDNIPVLFYNDTTGMVCQKSSIVDQFRKGYRGLRVEELAKDLAGGLFPC